MIREIISLDEVIEFFNELIGIDSEAVGKLFNTRVECNEAMVKHPTVQVGRISEEDPFKEDPDASYKMGLIGILNGIFGDYPDEPLKGWGPIVADFDKETGKVIRVDRTRDWIGPKSVHFP